MAGRFSQGPSDSERRLSWMLLGVLVVTAAGVFAVSFRTDPWLAGTIDGGPPAAPKTRDAAPEPDKPDLFTALAPSLVPAGSPERFDTQTLADKIDGKADLYLEAGFRSLVTQRVSLLKDPDRWAEFFLFTMESAESAFAVFSRQRRSPAVPLSAPTFAYRAANAVCAAAGSFYVEAIGSDEHPELMEALTTTVAALAAKLPPSQEILRHLEFFPPEAAPHERAVLYKGSAFGYDGFAHTYAVSVSENGAALTAFVALGKDSPNDRASAEAFIRFLEENGAVRVSGTDSDSDAVVLDLYGFTEVVFSHGRYVAGIHEADRREAAERWAAILRERLRTLDGRSGSDPR